MKTVYRHEFNFGQRFLMKYLGLGRISGKEYEFKGGSLALHKGFEFILHRGTYFDRSYALTLCFFVWMVSY